MAAAVSRAVIPGSEPSVLVGEERSGWHKIILASRPDYRKTPSNHIRLLGKLRLYLTRETLIFLRVSVSDCGDWGIRRDFMVSLFSALFYE